MRLVKPLTSNLHPPITPPPRFVLSLFIVVALLQFPADIVIRSISAPLGILINEVVFILLLPLIAMRCAGFVPLHHLHFGHSSQHHLLSSVGLTLGTALLLNYVRIASQWLFPVDDAMRLASQVPIFFSGSLDFFLKMMLLCVIAPICEEIFLRSLIQDTVAHRIGKHRAVLLTAIFFSLMHATAWHLHLYFFLGLLLAWIYAVTGTLRVSILCHMINNTFVLVTEQQGISFPLESPFGWFDLLTLGSALLLVAMGVVLLSTPKKI